MLSTTCDPRTDTPWTSRKGPQARAIRLAVVAACSLAAVLSTALAPPATAQGLPLIRDSEIEALLSDYAQPIFRTAGLGTGRVAVRLVKNEAFNAFVLDGNN